MTKHITSGAVQADADVLNAIQPPAKGCPAGGGLQISIPGDWQSRISLGQAVPGCSYAALEAFDGSLYVGEWAIGQLGIGAIINALPAQLKSQAALLNVKLLTAQVTS